MKKITIKFTFMCGETLKTEIIRINPDAIDMDKLRYCAQVIKKGGLVAFPTETVYGLGANAMDESAVNKIFKAKGRPQDNPLIVHICERKELDALTPEIPPEALLLADEFWPGPITMIFKKALAIPMTITAGLNTVAIRMPSHPVALAFISACGVPIAAPSANTSGKPSPTRAGHVMDDLSGRVEVIIDAGDCQIGLESTVLDLSIQPPVILRPGAVGFEELLKFIPDVVHYDNRVTADLKAPKSPGMKYRHYSPEAQVILVEGKLDDVVKKVMDLVEKYSNEGMKPGILATSETCDCYSGQEVIILGSRERPQEIAANLFNSLREMDMRMVDVIIAEAVDVCGIGNAIMNRLRKASGYNIVNASGNENRE